MLLTLNEEHNIESCLRALAAQTCQDFEVIVIDAASTDATAHLIRRAQQEFPVSLRLSVAKRQVPIGEARNHGVSLARGPSVAFVSADAELHPGWVDEALRSLGAYDMAFGRQIHAPRSWTWGACVRGLHYDYPETEMPEAWTFASNVAAAYRKDVLLAFPFDAWANAAEDVRLARYAHAAGFRGVYNPRMVVRHHDVSTAGQAWNKRVREGEGWGSYARELGFFTPLLAWGAAVLATLFLLITLPSIMTLLLWAATLWMPALRRALLRRHAMPWFQLARGAAASPAFDVAFLASYVRALVLRPRVGPKGGVEESHS